MIILNQGRLQGSAISLHLFCTGRKRLIRILHFKHETIEKIFTET